MINHRILKQGMAGEDVKILQKLLIAEGFGQLLGKYQDDGRFGTDTRKAVEALQIQNKNVLAFDGKAGEEVWNFLKARHPTILLPDSNAYSSDTKSIDSLQPAILNNINSYDAETIKKIREANLKHNTQDNRHMDKAEVRLAQSYLFMMNYLGDVNTVASTEVVHGRLDIKTQDAFQQFARDHGTKYGLTSGDPTKGLLHAIISKNAEYKTQVHGSDTYPSTFSEAERTELAQAFNHIKPYDRNGVVISHIHPVMRLPALAAIHKLEDTYHIKVVCTEGYRSPEMQDKLVMTGVSTSPAGYSFHGTGLALDIAPADAKGNPVTNDKDPRWSTINHVMEQYGFFSMQLHFGWDKPHHELPAKTLDMVSWKTGGDGWKEIPADKIPPQWLNIDEAALNPSPLHVAAIEKKDPSRAK